MGEAAAAAAAVQTGGAARQQWPDTAERPQRSSRPIRGR